MCICRGRECRCSGEVPFNLWWESRLARCLNLPRVPSAFMCPGPNTLSCLWRETLPKSFLDLRVNITLILNCRILRYDVDSETCASSTLHPSIQLFLSPFIQQTFIEDLILAAPCWAWEQPGEQVRQSPFHSELWLILTLTPGTARTLWCLGRHLM